MIRCFSRRSRPKRVGALLTKELLLLLPLLVGLAFAILQLIFISVAYQRVSQAAEVAAGVAARGGTPDEIHEAAGRVLAIYAGEYQTDVEYTGIVVGDDAACVRVKIPMGVASPPFGGLIGNFTDSRYCLRSIVCRTLEAPPNEGFQGPAAVMYWGNSVANTVTTSSGPICFDPGFEARSISNDPSNPPPGDTVGIPAPRDGVLRNLYFRAFDNGSVDNSGMTPAPVAFRLYAEVTDPATMTSDLLEVEVPAGALSANSNDNLVSPMSGEVVVEQGDLLRICAEPIDPANHEINLEEVRISVSFDTF